MKFIYGRRFVQRVSTLDTLEDDYTVPSSGSFLSVH